MMRCGHTNPWRGMLLAAVFLLAMSSCNRKVSLSTYENVRPKDIAVILDTTSLEFDQMRARFRIHADLNGDRKNFNADIRWERHKQLWMSFSILGIEGVRALFTPDSIHILNKLENTYYYGDYASLERLSNVSLTFAEIEELLLGRLIAIDDRKPEVRYRDGKVFLAMRDDEYNALVDLDKQTVSIQQFWINSLDNARRLEVTLDDYQVVGAKRWPNSREYYIVNGDMYLRVGATSQKLVLNEHQEYPFSVNPKYRRVPL